MLESLWQQPRNQKVAVLLALVGAVMPMVVPLVGLHKFYLRQPGWGVVYLLLFATPIPHVASAIEAVWYLLLPSEEFEERFNGGFGGAGRRQMAGSKPEQVGAVAEALRQLEGLRQEGLLSEYEFEQKRRQLLEHL
ncbi:NINE protein [Spirulina subsalsa FACHB-351]|uniref:NINE protein n=1 Tax=Spirulina subsalsa FACHB-351 TaxID=234711 RepID=A0ABT3L4G1_9CYAN|nr:NINE protein [Spirulina subsalsa]MCW6036381.1 NINE protein [Spirulina subsalsa FACHB-351]